MKEIRTPCRYRSTNDKNLLKRYFILSLLFVFDRSGAIRAALDRRDAARFGSKTLLVLESLFYLLKAFGECRVMFDKNRLGRHHCCLDITFFLFIECLNARQLEFARKQKELFPLFFLCDPHYLLYRSPRVDGHFLLYNPLVRNSQSTQLLRIRARKRRKHIIHPLTRRYEIGIRILLRQESGGFHVVAASHRAECITLVIGGRAPSSPFKGHNAC